MPKYITFEGEGEILMCTEEDEDRLRELYDDRDFDNEYDRKEWREPVRIVSAMTIS